ncbi:MAG: hypothetical protein A4E35_01556 [Methanoregula sp. PtaU1.Bin051]|nr:MAG: hypothetical protein A4E35_01556 [Methanoregula sp. PtaU1.Bin051]
MEEKNQDVVAYCGLCCLDCHGYIGKIPDLARDLKKELKKAHYEKFAGAISKLPFGKPFEHYNACMDLLGTMAKFRCTKTCRGGGGPPFCEIRKCCRSKKITGCWECSEPDTCDKLKFLEGVHIDAHKKNIRAIRKKGTGGFLSGKRYW